MKKLNVIMLFLMLLANVAFSANHFISTTEGSILLCKKTNLCFDSIHKDITKVILAYHTNQSIIKDCDDNIEVTVDINGDVYIRLGLHNYSHNKEYLKAKAKGDIPTLFFKGNQPWRQRVYSSSHTYRLNPHDESNVLSLSYSHGNVQHLFMDYIGQTIPSHYNPEDLSSIIIVDAMENFRVYDENVKYPSFVYEEIHLTNPASLLK